MQIGEYFVTQDDRTTIIGQLTQERSAVARELKELEAEASRLRLNFERLVMALGTPHWLFLDGEGMTDEQRRVISVKGSPGDYTLRSSAFPPIEKIKVLCNNIREKKIRLGQLTDQLKGFGVEF
jgi:hypothetical protein